VTQWVENPQGGRDRGLRGLVRAWFEVLVRPRRFFRNGIAPADQAPGLVFVIAVTLVFLAGRLVFAPETLPWFGTNRVVSAAIVLGVGGFLVAPLALHLTAALQTLALMPLVSDRAGISETVQTIAYATAPCVFVAVPIPAVQLIAATYGFVLLVLGLSIVHATTLARALLASLIPGLFVFGFVFGGVDAFETVTGVELIDDPREP